MTVEQLLSECDLVRLTEETAKSYLLFVTLLLFAVF